MSKITNTYNVNYTLFNSNNTNLVQTTTTGSTSIIEDDVYKNILSQVNVGNSQRLYVHGNITNSFICILKSCFIEGECNRQLLELSLRNVNLNYTQAGLIFTSLKNTHLEILDLSSNNIADSLKSFASILPSTNIRELILSNISLKDTHLTDDFFIAVSNSQVTKLDLSYNIFGRKVLYSIVTGLFNSKKLEFLNLKGNKVISVEDIFLASELLEKLLKASPLQFDTYRVLIRTLEENYHSAHSYLNYNEEKDKDIKETTLTNSIEGNNIISIESISTDFSVTKPTLNTVYDTITASNARQGREGWNSSLVDLIDNNTTQDINYNVDNNKGTWGLVQDHLTEFSIGVGMVGIVCLSLIGLTWYYCTKSHSVFNDSLEDIPL